MSLERLKKYCTGIFKASTVLLCIVIAIIICTSICFMWQALMPGKLNGFFEVFRIYAPFISNIDNNGLCLFELAGSLFSALFVFLILVMIRRAFKKLSETLSLEDVTHEIKLISVILIIDAIAVPIVKAICYAVFVKLPLPTGTIDLVPVILGLVLYFFAIIIQSKSVIKE